MYTGSAEVLEGGTARLAPGEVWVASRGGGIHRRKCKQPQPSTNGNVQRQKQAFAQLESEGGVQDEFCSFCD